MFEVVKLIISIISLIELAHCHDNHEEDYECKVKETHQHKWSEDTDIIKQETSSFSNE